MTRINLVPVEELSDQHLIAEYRELPRCIKQNIDISDAPEKYCLGKGHMKWAKKHTGFILDRYYEICNEMKYRGFKVNYPWEDLAYYAMQHCGDEIYNMYTPDEKAIAISKERLITKIADNYMFYKWTRRKRPNWTFWYVCNGQPIPKEYFKKLYDEINKL